MGSVVVATLDAMPRNDGRITAPPDPPADRQRFELRVDLVGAKPPIWRRITLPGDITLDRLHDVLQTVFGWQDSHLHRFSPTDDRYSSTLPIVTQYDLDEGEEGTLESTIRLDQLVERVGDSLFYTYDFGDDWEHRLRVESVGSIDPADVRVHCTDGRRSAPPEDSGGIDHFQYLIEVAADPQHPDAADLAEIIEALEVHDLDDTVDLVAIERALTRLAGARVTLEWIRQNDSPLRRLFDRTGPEAQQHLAGFVTDARSAHDAAPSLELATGATAVIRTFLSHVPAEGIPLSSAGYLPPASVSAMMDDLDPDRDWIGTANREANTVPLLRLRETVTALGLTRKYRGRLDLTARGRAVRDDPIALWRHLETRLPVERTPHGTDIGLLLLMLVGSQEVDVTDQLDMMTLMVGWSFPDVTPRRHSAAMRVVSATGDVLEWAGSGRLMARRRERDPLGEPGAVSLARASVLASALNG